MLGKRAGARRIQMIDDLLEKHHYIDLKNAAEGRRI